MALYRIRLIQNQTSLAPRDRCVMSWGISAPAAPSIADLTALDTAWAVALNTSFSGAILRASLASGLTPYLWEAYAAAGGDAIAAFPAAAVNRAGQGATVLPPEVALVCSQLITTVRGSRPIGRTYYGPWSTLALLGTTGRVPAGITARVLGVAVAHHNAMVGRGFTPVVLNKAGTVSRGNIIGYQVDDGWDTVRSRGVDAAVYSVQSV
jgi:hypothetical protein